MITNHQLQNLLKKDGIILSEEDSNTLRTFLIKLAKIEYDCFTAKNPKTNATEIKQIEEVCHNSKSTNLIAA